MSVSDQDRGLLYGDGLFETMLIRAGRIPLLEHHLRRLEASARLIGLPLPEGLAERCREAASAAGAGALRLTVTRGAAQRGFNPPASPHPTVLLHTSPYASPAGGWRAVTSATVRANPASILWRVKSLSALEKVLARAEAARAGADEALILNLDGAYAEGAATNLFLVVRGQALTPPVADGCLPGVARAVMLEAGAHEARLRPDMLDMVDGAFLTNALAGVIPLTHVDGRPLPTSPVTDRFCAAWEAAVGT